VRLFGYLKRKLPNTKYLKYFTFIPKIYFQKEKHVFFNDTIQKMLHILLW